MNEPRRNTQNQTHKKTDRRRNYTQSVIKEAFVSLLRTRHVSKISVTEICKLADINRGTFYLHYHDPYDLLEKLEAEHCNAMIEAIGRDLLADGTKQHIFNLSKLIHNTIQADEALNLLANTPPSSHNIQQRLVAGLASKIKPRLVNLGYNEEEAAAVYIFLFSGYQAVDTYLRKKKASTVEVETVMDVITSFVRRGLPIGH